MARPALHSRVIPASQYRRQRWRNGCGWTREIDAGSIIAGPAHASPPQGQGAAWDWRLSIAEIEHDAPFSRFPGVERELLLLSGNGLRLRFDDGPLHRLDPPHGRLRFSGERALSAELVDGPTQGFNLMWRRDVVDAELLHRPLVGPMLFFAEPGNRWALHLMAGHARFDAGARLPALAAGDTALLAAPERTRFLLDGGGELLAIRLTARALP